MAGTKDPDVHLIVSMVSSYGRNRLWVAFTRFRCIGGASGHHRIPKRCST